MAPQPHQRWRRQVAWIDFILVVLAVAILLFLTIEFLLPYWPFGQGR